MNILLGLSGQKGVRGLFEEEMGYMMPIRLHFINTTRLNKHYERQSVYQMAYNGWNQFANFEKHI